MSWNTPKTFAGLLVITAFLVLFAALEFYEITNVWLWDRYSGMSIFGSLALVILTIAAVADASQFEESSPFPMKSNRKGRFEIPERFLYGLLLSQVFVNASFLPNWLNALLEGIRSVFINVVFGLPFFIPPALLFLAARLYRKGSQWPFFYSKILSGNWPFGAKGATPRAQISVYGLCTDCAQIVPPLFCHQNKGPEPWHPMT